MNFLEFGRFITIKTNHHKNMLKKSQVKYSLEKNKLDNSLHHSSLSSLRPTLKPLQLKDRKSSEKRLLRFWEPKNNISRQLELDVRQKKTCYLSFMKKVQKENTQDLPDTFSLIELGEKKFNSFMLENYEDPNFKILNCSNDSLISISTEIVCKFGLGEICGKFPINKFIKEVANGYNTVSYHNFAHGFSLMHMFYHMIKMDRKLKMMFTKEEIGFTLLAALGHDLNHQGTNNVFEIKTGSELAKIANNEAVLEKMHIKQFFSIVKNKNITFFDRTKNPKKMRELITRVILATDVSRHFKGVERLKAMKNNGEFNPKEDEHRYFILEQAFHACDIGNPCLEYNDYINWASLLTYEFNNQTKLEAQKGVEVTEMLRFKGKKQFYEGQLGFINALVVPLWKELSESYTGLSPFVKNIYKNIEKLKSDSAKEEL